MIEVRALFRHPIKSHGREAVDRVELTAGQTMPWDRTWAVTHDATKFDANNPAWARCSNFMIGARTPGLVGIWARLDESARKVTLTHADLPDLTICPDAPDDVARFLDWVAPLCPPDRSAPSGIVSVLGRGMTDSDFPSVSIMNMASHAAVMDAMRAPITIERWRGNIWLDGLESWAEHDWMNRKMRIGAAVLLVRERIQRCSVTNTNPETGVRDTPTLDVLNGRFGHQDFGVYAEVVQSGEIAIGDKAELIP